MKQHTKLFATALLLLVAVIMVVATSYAWMTISESPLLQGIQVTVGGGGTVLVAPDMTLVKGNKEYHFPGAFSESLNFADYEQYSYLEEIAGLVPVSTADGETWYIPAYYQSDDDEVLSGQAYAGQLRPVSEFVKDNMLNYANLGSDDGDKIQQGSYIYLDFWVVAPVDGFQLRVSTNEESIGSYVIDLLEPELTASGDTESYTLTGENSQAAACMRVGFLVNEDTIMDESMQLYSQSSNYSGSYTRLQGIYSEAGYSALYSAQTRFTIYEPNGDSHPTLVTDANGTVIEDGQYVLTEPLNKDGSPVSVSDRLTVQLSNDWIMSGEETLLSQIFGAFSAGKNTSDVTAQSLKQEFYSQYLQYQIHPYLTTGSFLTRTADLYSAAGEDGILLEGELGALRQSGATDDVYLTELTGGVPQRIRMFIWLEGQDVDCINSAAAGSFAISIELAGSNAS